ncbi:MAG: chitobiase/beta-hexosaminidase C-terminal domain-containing protein [Candidatus Cloacimonadaceae bacterium]
MNKVSDPVFSPEGGHFTHSQVVTINCATEGAQIYYTLDGRVPSVYEELYTEPLSVELGTHVKAIAVKAGMGNSNVASANYLSTPPCLFSSCDIPNYAHSLALKDDFVYVASGYTGLVVVNINNLERPQVIGSCNTPGSANSVAISGNYAYVSDGNSGLQIVNISNPASLVITGSLDIDSHAYGIAVSGNYAYLGGGWRLLVVNISNPENPVIAGSCITPDFDYAKKVAVSGNHAYVTNGDYGLQVIDISNPANPHIVSTCGIMDNAVDVAVSDNYAYVTSLYDGIHVIDISNPINPTVSGVCLLGRLSGIVVNGNFAYATGNWGLYVVDISNSTNPVPIGGCFTPASAYDVAIRNNYAFVAANESGLQIIELD